MTWPTLTASTCCRLHRFRSLDGAGLPSWPAAMNRERPWPLLRRPDPGRLCCRLQTPRQKGPCRLEWTIKAHINPELGDTPVEKLTRRRIEGWHAKLAENAAPAADQGRETPEAQGAGQYPRGIRRRRSTANRVLTIFKAALNLAHHNRRADAPERWQAVKPFRETNEPKVRYLTDAESQEDRQRFIRPFRAW